MPTLVDIRFVEKPHFHFLRSGVLRTQSGKIYQENMKLNYLDLLLRVFINTGGYKKSH